MFPQKLALASSDANAIEKMEKERETEAESASPTSVREWVTEFKVVARRLLSKKVYVLNMFSRNALIFALVGWFTFLPKYLEYQFRQTASASGGLGGLSKTVSSVVALVGSGALISRFKPRAFTLAGLCAATMFTWYAKERKLRDVVLVASHYKRPMDQR